MGVHVDETGRERETVRITRSFAGQGAQMLAHRGNAPGMDTHVGGKRGLARAVVDFGVLDEYVGRMRRVAGEDDADENAQETVSHPFLFIGVRKQASRRETSIDSGAI